MPTAALLIPCKNGAPFLPRLLASAHAQTRQFDEIWLFDDGSEDNSAAVAQAKGARVLRAPRSLGPSAARNRLMQATDCDWLHFHDADDTMDARYLEEVLKLALPGTDAVICDMLWIREDTGAVDNYWTYDGDALARNPAAYLITNTVGGINGLYRRRTTIEAGGFNEKLHFWEDLDFNLRLARRGAKTAVLNQNLVTAYRRGASHSNANLGDAWRVKLGLMGELLPEADELLRATVAAEAETIADRLAALGCWQWVPAALNLARKAGGNPPTTCNPILRALKIAPPARWTFRLQRTIRRSLHR